MSNTDFDIMPGVPGGELSGVVKPAPAKISGDEDYAKLAPGAKFIGPDGQERTKPYELKTGGRWADIPEGAQFVDPEGQLRSKPTYEGVGFTAQTLYDMAVTPKERKKALEFEYPGKVKEDEDGLFVEDEGGKLRRPGRGTESVTGFAAGAALPTAGAVLGALGGGAVGGPAAFATGAVGGAGGAMLGQSFNDAILGLAGVYDRTLPEEAANMGMAGAGGMMGAGVGRGLSTVLPSIKAGVSAAGAALPRGAAHFLVGEKTPEKVAALAQGRELAEQGVLVPPSAVFPEAPHVQNIVEVFDPAFRTNKPLRQSAEQFYEKKAGDILQELGVEREGSILSPKAEVPTLRAGERIMQTTLAEQAEADNALKAALEKRAEELKAGMPEKTAQREAVLHAAEESRSAAQKLVDQGFKDINGDVEAAFKVSKAGANSGDLWEQAGNKLRVLRQGIGQRAKYWYDRYDEMTGGARVSSQELADSAREMLEQLPAQFKSNNPSLVQKLEKLGAVHGEDGELVKDAEQLTYGQLHDLRSVFRNSADWTTLSSDFKNGSLKRFSNEIDRMIHDPAAPENVRNAAKFLDVVDKWYGKNIKIFNANQIKAVMRGLEAGEPADPKALYNAVIKEGHGDLIERIKHMVGPNLWAGIKAADTQAMLDAAKTLEPGMVDARKFAAEVLEREKSNLLSAVHGKDSQKLLGQARAIEQLAGRLPVPTHPGDTLTQVIARAKQAETVAKEAARKDPLGELNKEAKRLQAALQNWDKGAPGRVRAMRRDDPLAFLHDATTGGIEAVNRILKSEDLILAAAAKFGERSEQFNSLRQIYVQHILEGTLNPARKLASVSPEIQQLMFPGVTLEQMHTLARNMEFLMTRRGMSNTTAGSMSAMAKVEHPLTGQLGKYIPGPVRAVGAPVGAVARAVMGKYYAFVTKLATSPATLRWIEKGLNGTPEERAAVKIFTDKVLQKGTAVGAGTGEATEQSGMQ